MILSQPTREAVKAAREHAGQTQEQAAESAGLSARVRWTEYENGTRQMDATRWTLYLLATGQHPTFKLVRKRT